MRTAIILLAIAGIAAVLLRISAAAFALLRGGVDTFLAQEMEKLKAQRGDITGAQEAAMTTALARRRRFFAFSIFFMWLGLLLVPPLTPWPQLLYAGYALL